MAVLGRGGNQASQSYWIQTEPEHRGSNWGREGSAKLSNQTLVSWDVCLLGDSYVLWGQPGPQEMIRLFGVISSWSELRGFAVHETHDNWTHDNHFVDSHS